MIKVKALLYCTKAKPYLLKIKSEEVGFMCNYKQWLIDHNNRYQKMAYNDKIVAECEVETEKFYCCCVPYRNINHLGYEYFIDNGVYKVEWKENINLVDDEKKYNNPDIYKNYGVVFERKDKYIDTMLKNSDLKEMCLTPQELLDYLTLGNKGYALHLSNLKTFDKPLELSECEKDFKGKPASHYWIGRLTDNYVDDNWSDLVCVQRAPTNMCWVWYKGERYVLISIRPEWLCKILNGEKTIEVRRKVLKGMME